jgi:hypothetical protein
VSVRGDIVATSAIAISGKVSAELVRNAVLRKSDVNVNPPGIPRGSFVSFEDDLVAGSMRYRCE